MRYIELKDEIEELQNKYAKRHCQGFEESFDFAHFETFYALLDEPKYAIMQAKDNLDMNTNSSQWFLVFDHNGQMTVIDISDEETICDEFFQLILIWFKGNKTVKIQKQQNFFQKFKSKLYGSGN